jgi:hypothetical protein
LKCEHTDCAESREAVKVRCAICQKPIGYDTKFFRDWSDDASACRTTHMICRVREIERNKSRSK